MIVDKHLAIASDHQRYEVFVGVRHRNFFHVARGRFHKHDSRLHRKVP